MKFPSEGTKTNTQPAAIPVRVSGSVTARKLRQSLAPRS